MNVGNMTGQDHPVQYFIPWNPNNPWCRQVDQNLKSCFTREREDEVSIVYESSIGTEDSAGPTQFLLTRSLPLLPLLEAPNPAEMSDKPKRKKRKKYTKADEYVRKSLANLLCLNHREPDLPKEYTVSSYDLTGVGAEVELGPGPRPTAFDKKYRSALRALDKPVVEYPEFPPGFDILPYEAMKVEKLIGKHLGINYNSHMVNGSGETNQELHNYANPGPESAPQKKRTIKKSKSKKLKLLPLKVNEDSQNECSAPPMLSSLPEPQPQIEDSTIEHEKDLQKNVNEEEQKQQTSADSEETVNVNVSPKSPTKPAQTDVKAPVTTCASDENITKMPPPQLPRRSARGHEPSKWIPSNVNVNDNGSRRVRFKRI